MKNNTSLKEAIRKFADEMLSAYADVRLALGGSMGIGKTADSLRRRNEHREDKTDEN